MPRGVKPIYTETELHDEIKKVAEKMGFKKLTDFLRVWWTNPVEFGKIIENAKKEIEEASANRKEGER